MKQKSVAIVGAAETTEMATDFCFDDGPFAIAIVELEEVEEQRRHQVGTRHRPA